VAPLHSLSRSCMRPRGIFANALAGRLVNAASRAPVV
jgi:hypothetical protein